MNTNIDRSARPASTRRRRTATTHPLERLLGGDAASNRYGVGLVVAVLECSGADRVLHVGQFARFSRQPARGPGGVAIHPAMPAAVARVLAGLAHPDRVRIAQAILRGANSHHALAEVVKLQAGPLYHHLKELDRAGLIAREQRNQYGLTKLGRILVHLAPLVSAAGDTRVRHWKTSHLKGSPTGRSRSRKVGRTLR